MLLTGSILLLVCSVSTPQWVMNSEREIKHDYSVCISHESALSSKNILDGLVECEKIKNSPAVLTGLHSNIGI